MMDYQQIHDGIVEVQRQMLVGCTDPIIGDGSCRCCQAFRCIDALWKAAENIAKSEWHDSAPQIALQFYYEALVGEQRD